MVNEYSVNGCLTNHVGSEIEGRVSNGSVFICASHFERQYIRCNDKKSRLIIRLFPLTTILPPGTYHGKPTCMPTRHPAARPLHNECIKKKN